MISTFILEPNPDDYAEGSVSSEESLAAFAAFQKEITEEIDKEIIEKIKKELEKNGNS
jgi:hypothetical protein